MCGIAGLLSKNAPLPEGFDLDRMLAAQSHRGPDDTGQFQSPFFQVGMVRLSILDLVSPNLCPLIFSRPGSPDVSHVLSYNGELYNYVELRKELETLGHELRTTGDTEVLLHSYLEWGEGCLDRLNGMYAFVIADFEEDLLFCARDIAGEKPLYYYEDRNVFLFSSEIKGILSQIPMPEMNITDEFNAFEYVTGEETLFQNVSALRPGFKMVIRGLRGNYRGKRVTEYWSLVDHLYDVDPEHAVDQLDELLSDAVRIRLRADVKIGLYLSGGIDSSLMAYMAKPEIAFSVHFPYGKKYDELSYAQTVAREIGCEHVVIQPTKDDFEEHLDSIIYHLDTPVGSFSPFPLYMLAREASQRVKIVLSGEGADELFSGYTRYLLLDHNEKLRDVAELKNYDSLMDYYYGPPLEQMARLLNRGNVSDDVIRLVIKPHFTQFDDVRHAMGYTEYKTMLIALLQMGDRTSAAFGIENRSPFLDKRVIAFAFSIPGDLKIRGYTTKWILKEVARRYVPTSVVDRTGKQGLIAPINLWMNFRGARGEFDRQAYNTLMMERWYKVFYGEQWFNRPTIPAVSA